MALLVGTNPPVVLLRAAAMLRPSWKATRLLTCLAVPASQMNLVLPKRCSQRVDNGLSVPAFPAGSPGRVFSTASSHRRVAAAAQPSRRNPSRPTGGPAGPPPPQPLRLAPLANGPESAIDNTARSGDSLDLVDGTCDSAVSPSSASSLYESVPFGTLSGRRGLTSARGQVEDGAGLSDSSGEEMVPADEGADDDEDGDDVGAEDKQQQSNDTSRERSGSDLERVYLVGVDVRQGRQGARGTGAQYSINESLEELAQLAGTAGLEVAGSTFQVLSRANPATYIGSGKVAELAAAVQELRVETVIFDDELSPGQLRNLEEAFGGKVKVCDRTALILDIFSQRAQTREGKLQVELARVEYQLPRLTRMWTHLDRVGGGGQVKGTGEKQIETDKRELRDKVSQLKKELDQVRTHRRNNRSRRSQMPTPVVAIVGYTNAGKSTLLNRLTAAGVLAEDKLFATLDPTTRRLRLPSSKEVLLSDTVGFIQKLPTELVAAFRATLEEIEFSSVLLHVVDISHPGAMVQAEAVEKVLADLAVKNLPLITAWNKVDACEDPDAVRAAARARPNTLCISGKTGEGLPELLECFQRTVESSMVFMRMLLPYSAGSVLDEIHTIGSVQSKEYSEHGTEVTAFVPAALAGRLHKYALAGSDDQPSSDPLDGQVDAFDADGYIEQSTTRVPA